MSSPEPSCGNVSNPLSVSESPEVEFRAVERGEKDESKADEVDAITIRLSKGSSTADGTDIVVDKSHDGSDGAEGVEGAGGVGTGASCTGDDGTTEGRTPASSSAEPQKPKTRWQKAKPYLLKYHLPMGLAFAVILGFLVPAPGKEVKKLPVTVVCLIGIFLITGLKLKTASVKAALTEWKGMLFSVISILIITPCIAFAIVRLPLSPDEFAKGLAFFAIMPTTVSSGAVLVGVAGGNVALAIILAASTNIIGVFTVPVAVALVLNTDGGSLDPIPMLVKLLYSILAPLIVGKIISSTFAKVREVVAKYGKTLKLFASFLLILIPWTKVSDSSDDIKEAGILNILLLFVLGAALHLVFIAYSATGCVALKIQRDEKVAVVFSVSQKTLSVAVAVISFLPDSVGSQGLLIIPCIIAHFVQIVIDAAIAAYWPKASPTAGSKKTDDAPSKPLSAADAAASRDSVSGDDATGVDTEEVSPSTMV